MNILQTMVVSYGLWCWQIANTIANGNSIAVLPKVIVQYDHPFWVSKMKKSNVHDYHSVTPICIWVDSNNDSETVNFARTWSNFSELPLRELGFRIMCIMTIQKIFQTWQLFSVLYPFHKQYSFS